MKSLTTITPRVIFLVGIPGAGKTYFAEKFAKTFGAPFIETDKIRRTVFATPTYSHDEQKIVDQLAAYQLSELMKTKKTILYEGGTEARIERMTLAKFVRANGYEPLIVWVQTEPTTAKSRATRGVRGHAKSNLISEERFNQLQSRFTAPNSIETPTVISGKHTSASQTKVVLKRLALPRQQEIETMPVVPSRSSIAKSGSSIKIN
jgi:shikimate kinase